jgi:hypothetical protein
LRHQRRPLLRLRRVGGSKSPALPLSQSMHLAMCK